jgi:hypothetical protein
MDDMDLNQTNGDATRDDIIRFESLDDGAAVMTYAGATAEGAVSLALSHQMDGDLEVFMDPRTAEELALTLARAADEARKNARGVEI